MNEITPHQTSEYRSFLVRFQRQISSDDAHADWRIFVRGVADGRQVMLTTITDLVEFLAAETAMEIDK